MNKEFEVHMLTEEGKKKAREIAEAFDVCLKTIINLREQDDGCIPPQGRYISIVRTKLEEACFFAKKDMAENNCL